MKYRELIKSYKKKGIKLISYGGVKELGKIYPLYKIKINNKSSKTLIVTTGFHGEEFNGPISLLNIIKEIIVYSQKKKVNLIIYPCINPSGFDLKQRYNASNETQSNYFIKYQKKDGSWTGLVKPKQKFIKWKMIEPPAKETKILKKDLLKTNIIPVGLIDIHQDSELAKGCHYAYIFDKKEVYNKIMAKIDRIAKRSRNVNYFDYGDIGVKFYDKIDKNGFISIHDCTMTDMFYRLGSEFVVTAETNSKAPLKTVKKINKIWIKEMIDLVAKSNKLDLKIN